MQTSVSENKLLAETRNPADLAVTRRKIPLGLALAYTGFMAVLVPVYWANYGPANFLYFCDVALLITLAGIWTENKLLVSLPAVGILIPQALWVADFVMELSGHKLMGMTAYMFDSNRPLFLRGLSLFHGWLPFLLIYLVAKLGYDRRALVAWTAIAWSLCLVAFFFLPPSDPLRASLKTPLNVNFVYGLDDAKPQTWLPPGVYLAAWMTALFVLVFTPTHFGLRRFFGSKAVNI